jgi:prepilin-type N-terminal cleavage/methylation domain-containing protein
MNIKTNRKSGFTLVEIMIVVAIIGLLAAIAIPNFVRARESAQLNSIANNLRVIEGAKDQWSLENRKGTGDPCDMADLSDYIRGGTVNKVVNEVYSAEPVGAPAIADVGATEIRGYTGALTLDIINAPPP